MAFSLKGKKILCWDYGLSVQHCRALAAAGAKVYYYTPWDTAFPQFAAYAPGLGYEEEGLEKVYYFWPYVKEVDFIFFPDVGSGTEAQRLRETTDLPVFGSALKYEGGNRLELERWFMRQLQKKIGLPTQESVRIRGIPKLREYLDKNDKKFIKLDKFRGDIESFYAKNYESVKLTLDELEVNLGPFSDVFQFVAEDFVEGVEPGFDCFFNGKDWVKPYLWGIEQSKACYIGKFVNKLPTPLEIIAEKLKPVLVDMEYRGPVSIEARVMKDGTPYLIDICTRYAYPLSICYPLAIKNYAEVVWKVGIGEAVTIEPTATYVSAVPLSSQHAKNHFVKLEFPPEYGKYIKPYASAKLGKFEYGVKTHETLFVLSVAGNDWKKLIPATEVLSQKVDAYGLDLDVISGLHRIEDVISEYKTHGMGEF